MIRLSTYIAHSASQGYALRFPNIGEGNYRPAYYTNGTNFVHGGKGFLQNYNADQKTAIRALPQTADGNDYYLFFVDCYDRLDTAGMVSNEIVSGYMPVGRHYGFIYNEFNNPRTIAHELGHGVNALHHTFSAESESFHTTERTDNLMDYNGGTALNHKQWQWSHETHKNVLGFLDEEEEGEGNTLDPTIQNLKWISLDKDYNGIFITPCGSPIYLSLSKGTDVAVMIKNDIIGNSELNSKSIYGFVIDGKRYLAEIAYERFMGYFAIGQNTKEEYNDTQTIDYVPKSGAYNVWSWDIEENVFKESKQIFSVNKNECIFFNPETKELLVVTDVHDLRWLPVQSKSFSLSEIQYEKINVYSECQLSETEYNPIIKSIYNRWSPLQLLEFPLYEILYNCIDVACDYFISIVFRGETETCMREFWDKNKEEFIDTILKDKKLRGKVLENITSVGNLLDILYPKFSQLFSKDDVVNAMSDCLVSYAMSLCPEVETLDENTKLSIMRNDSRKTVGILLYEFATGKGENVRYFDCTQGENYPFVDEYLKGRIAAEIKNDMLDYLDKKHMTFTQFMNGECEVSESIGLELTPGGNGGISILESLKRHVTSNIEQLFIGGSLVTSIKPHDTKSIVTVTIKNKTSRSSLFLHLAEDMERIEFPYAKMSDVSQIMTFNMDIDDVSILSSSLSDVFVASDNVLYLEGNLLTYAYENKLQKKLLVDIPLKVITDIIEILKEHYGE